MIGGGMVITQIFVILMILALFLAIMTAMAGSSRTLYQGSRDGWLPKYLSQVNSHGAPTGRDVDRFRLQSVSCWRWHRMSAGYFFVLAISNVGYIMFNFLNLNAGWIHRIDTGHMARPWRAPTWLIGFNTVLAFVNAAVPGRRREGVGLFNMRLSGPACSSRP